MVRQIINQRTMARSSASKTLLVEPARAAGGDAGAHPPRCRSMSSAMSLRSVMVTGSRLPAGNSGRRGRGTASTCRRMALAQGRVLEKGLSGEPGEVHVTLCSPHWIAVARAAAPPPSLRRAAQGRVFQPRSGPVQQPRAERVLESGTLGRTCASKQNTRDGFHSSQQTAVMDNATQRTPTSQPAC